jgi:DNA-damage-inducible protein D
METESSHLSLQKDLDSIKRVGEDGVEYWEGRDLMTLLEYPHWGKAEEVIGRAARACINSGEPVDNHFYQTVKMVNIGSNTVRRIRDYRFRGTYCYSSVSC